MNNYVLGENIGRGNYGEIFIAYKNNSEFPYVIK